MRHLTLTALLIAALALLHAADPVPNSFFVMDTAVRSLDKLEAVKVLGYAGIGWKAGPPEQLADAVKQLRERDLKLFAIYAGATLTKTALTWSQDTESDLAVLNGTNAIVWLPIYSQDYGPSAVEGDDVAVPALARLADLAAAHGVRIAIYPHKGAWAERVQDAVRLAQKVNRKNLGATFNLCHCLMVGDEARIPELLEQAAPHLFLVTINGADAGAGGTSWDRLIRPLDEGSFDVRAPLAKLAAMHWTGPIGLQGFAVKLPVEENLHRSMSAWKRISQQSSLPFPFPKAHVLREGAIPSVPR